MSIGAKVATTLSCTERMSTTVTIAVVGVGTDMPPRDDTPAHHFVVVYDDGYWCIDDDTASIVFPEGTVFLNGTWDYPDRHNDTEKADLLAHKKLRTALDVLNTVKPKKKRKRKRKTCKHPIDTWEHRYDEDSKLGDYYTCGLCGEVTQVG